MSTTIIRIPSLNDPRFRCLCGLCHVVTGTQICLGLYVMASIFSVLFGSKDLLTWLLVPFFVVSLSTYAFVTERHKYLYPFLIITVLQQFVCLIMAFLLICFAIINLDALRKTIAHSLQLDGRPSIPTSLTLITFTVSLCILLALLHVWQAVIIYRCLEYYEEKSLVVGGRRLESTGPEWIETTAECRGTHTQ